MAFEPRDGQGSLFKNDRKEQETHADYNGSIRIDGHDYWLNAWVKDGAKGKFFSLSAKRKDGSGSRPDLRTPVGGPGQSAEGKAFIASQKTGATQPLIDDADIPF